MAGTAETFSVPKIYAACRDLYHSVVTSQNPVVDNHPYVEPIWDVMFNPFGTVMDG